VEEVMAAIQGQQNSANSSLSGDSGVVTSDKTIHVTVPNFILKAFQRLPKVNVLPSEQINKEVKEWKEDLNKALVPVKPVMHCLIIKAWATRVEDTAIPCTPTGQLSLPRTVTKKAGARTPLVDTLVRRSPRINPAAVDGYQIVPVKVKEPASKRRKKVAMLLDLDKKLPTNISDVINPTFLENIKEWAQACGVAPEELSDDALLKGHGDSQE
jgi:hypothetical protein